MVVYIHVNISEKLRLFYNGKNISNRLKCLATNYFIYKKLHACNIRKILLWLYLLFY